MEGMIGEVRIFAANFAPRAWALCAGQLLPIAQNTALFSIIGTIYGGDGRTTFQLPDCRGRRVIGPGNGPGLDSYREGEKGGVEDVILTQSEMPSHNHSGGGAARLNELPGDSMDPTNRNFSLSGSLALYVDGPLNLNMALDTDLVELNNTGGSQSHTNMSPWISMNYVICLQGVFPSRS